MQFPRIMSQEKDPKDPMEELKKNLDQVFKHGNAFFPMGSGPNQPSGATAKTESSQPENPNEDDEERAEILRRIQGFNLKPKEIRDYLDRFVIQQREAKKVISVSICDHYNHVRRCLENPEIKDRDYAKQNIILLGPTGVGKT